MTTVVLSSSVAPSTSLNVGSSSLPRNAAILVIIQPRGRAGSIDSARDVACTFVFHPSADDLVRAGGPRCNGCSGAHEVLVITLFIRPHELRLRQHMPLHGRFELRLATAAEFAQDGVQHVELEEIAVPPDRGARTSPVGAFEIIDTLPSTAGKVLLGDCL